MPDRKVAPEIIDAVDFDLKLKPVEHFRLDNGTDVYTINAGAEDVLSFEWVFYAGNWFEQQNLVAASTNFLLRNGTSTRTAFQINEHFEYYGSYLNRACYNETASITLHCLNKHINELLPVVKELILDSTLPQEELDIYRQNMKQRLQVNMKKSDFVASRMIDAHLFGPQHPYGKFSTFEDFDELDRSQLLEYFRNFYQTGKMILFVAGRLPDDLPAILNKCFGDMPRREIELAPIAPDPAVEKKYRVVTDPDSVQGSIRIASHFPGRRHPDFIRVMVLNTLLGGYFGSRLMSNIREDKGYTYGIHSYIQNHMHDTAWMISTEAGRDVCEATIAETYKEMEKLRAEEVDEDELQLVRNYMMGSILGDLDGPFQIIARWKNIILSGLTEKYFYDSIHTIKTISAGELKELAVKYLDRERFYELVVV